MPLVTVTEPSTAKIDDELILYRQQNWNPVVPTTQREGDTHRTFRSLVLVICSDPFCISGCYYGVITTTKSVLVVASIYIPGKSRSVYTTEDLWQSATTRSRALWQAIDVARIKHGRSTPIVIGWDFDRHDPVWGGMRAPQAQHTGEGELILQWMHDVELYHALPRGTVTCLHGQIGTTIDMLLLSHSLEQDVVKCVAHTAYDMALITKPLRCICL